QSALDDARQALDALVGNDVDAKELHASEKLSRAIFNGALDAMLLADDEGRYVDANPAACELFGLPRERLLGRAIADFAAAEYDMSAWEVFRTRGSLCGRFPPVRADGT